MFDKFCKHIEEMQAKLQSRIPVFNPAAPWFGRLSETTPSLSRRQEASAITCMARSAPSPWLAFDTGRCSPTPPPGGSKPTPHREESRETGYLVVLQKNNTASGPVIRCSDSTPVTITSTSCQDGMKKYHDACPHAQKFTCCPCSGLLIWVSRYLGHIVSPCFTYSAGVKGWNMLEQTIRNNPP